VDIVNEVKAELDSQIQHEFIERSCSKHEDYIVIIYRKKKKKKKKNIYIYIYIYFHKKIQFAGIS